MASNAASTAGGRLHLGPHVDGKRLAVGAGIVLAAVAVAIGVAAPGQSTDSQAAWEAGLNARSNALNQRYGLGAYATQPVPGSRAVGAYRAYEAGSYATTLPVPVSHAVGAYRAYESGNYAKQPVPSSHAVGAYRAYETGTYATTLP